MQNVLALVSYSAIMFGHTRAVNHKVMNVVGDNFISARSGDKGMITYCTAK